MSDLDSFAYMDALISTTNTGFVHGGCKIEFISFGIFPNTIIFSTIDDLSCNTHMGQYFTSLVDFCTP